MPVKIRLMRIGAKKRPFYRIVVVDERRKRTGQYIDLIGTYNPLTEPKDIVINKNKLEEWVKKGAVLSDGFLKITKQAPHKPARKPKKAQDEPAAAATPAAPAAAETVVEKATETVEAATEEVTTSEEAVADTTEAVESTEETTKAE